MRNYAVAATSFALLAVVVAVSALRTAAKLLAENFKLRERLRQPIGYATRDIKNGSLVTLDDVLTEGTFVSNVRHNG